MALTDTEIKKAKATEMAYSLNDSGFAIVHAPLEIKPGMPVVTTGFSLCLI